MKLSSFKLCEAIATAEKQVMQGARAFLKERTRKYASYRSRGLPLGKRLTEECANLTQYCEVYTEFAGAYKFENTSYFAYEVFL